MTNIDQKDDTTDVMNLERFFISSIIIVTFYKFTVVIAS